MDETETACRYAGSYDCIEGTVPEADKMRSASREPEGECEGLRRGNRNRLLGGVTRGLGLRNTATLCEYGNELLGSINSS